MGHARAQNVDFRMPGGWPVTSNKSESIADNVATLALADGHLSTADLELSPTDPSPLREAELQSYIGRELRSIYEDVLNEELPESLLRLIEELQSKQAQKS